MVGRPDMPDFFIDALLTGPPQASDASDGQEQTMWKRIWNRKIEIALLIGGLIFIGLGATVEKWSKIPDIWESEARTGGVALGTAMAIAGLLALTVDRKLKIDIAQDAFKHVMGWVSPPRLKSELMRVYREPFFAVEQHLTVTLTETSSDITRMELNIVRKIKNESLESREPSIALAVRKWFVPDRESEVTGISAIFRGTERNQRQKVDEVDKEAIDLHREELTPPIKLDPGEEATVFLGGFEDKLPNDVFWLVFRIPSENPRVTVIYPESIAVYVQFNSGEPQEPRVDQPTGDLVWSEWRLRGVMLPNQPIIIRWWPKDATPRSE